MPKIIVIGHLLLKLLQKMWSHVFLGHGVVCYNMHRLNLSHITMKTLKGNRRD